jgi:hypothetical protein
MVRREESLPFDSPVELEVIFEVKSDPLGDKEFSRIRR